MREDAAQRTEGLREIGLKVARAAQYDPRALEDALPAVRLGDCPPETALYHAREACRVEAKRRRARP